MLFGQRLHASWVTMVALASQCRTDTVVDPCHGVQAATNGVADWSKCRIRSDKKVAAITFPEHKGSPFKKKWPPQCKGGCAGICVRSRTPCALPLPQTQKGASGRRLRSILADNAKRRLLQNRLPPVASKGQFRDQRLRPGRENTAAVHTNQQTRSRSCDLWHRAFRPSTLNMRTARLCRHCCLGINCQQQSVLLHATWRAKVSRAARSV